MANDDIVLHIDRNGTTRSFYTDKFPLHKLGRLRVERLSHIEFNENSQKWEVWNANKTEMLFANRSRTKCLGWEEKNFKHNLPTYLAKAKKRESRLK